MCCNRPFVVGSSPAAVELVPRMVWKVLMYSAEKCEVSVVFNVLMRRIQQHCCVLNDVNAQIEKIL